MQHSCLHSSFSAGIRNICSLQFAIGLAVAHKRDLLFENWYLSRQIEKRLKVEQKSHGSSSSSSSSQVVPESSYKFTSTKSPMCSLLQLHFDLNYSFNNNNPTNLQESSNSEAPQAFLSLSPQFPQTQQNTPRLSIINKLRRLMMPKS